ncbi:MAG: 50S ribosomal protein L29 [Ardenticatenaceae bacterium]|nr:50S ribosomal protein L29 [Ardenticatenaceae bacterium]MCB9442737.1 50S ribosomal protein L29 [Ardenticatenaceae bacterium]
MANIVELRGMNGDKLEEMLENAREEMFNLRFRNASSQLEDYSRLKMVRREIAQLKTVLNMRQLAIDAAAAQPEIASVLVGKVWQATSRFIYNEGDKDVWAWKVEFVDGDGKDLASAMVDLNKKRPSQRKAYRQKDQPQLVTSYEIAG